MTVKHIAESGTVKGKDGKVVWTMTADEAEEIADFMEGVTVADDAAREDVRALRRAITDARTFR